MRMAELSCATNKLKATGYSEQKIAMLAVAIK